MSVHFYPLADIEPESDTREMCLSIDQIQIYVSVLQKGWVTLCPLSNKSSTRGILMALSIHPPAWAFAKTR